MTVNEMRELLLRFPDDYEIMVDNRNRLNDIADVYEDNIDETVYILIS